MGRYFVPETLLLHKPLRPSFLFTYSLRVCQISGDAFYTLLVSL